MKRILVELHSMADPWFCQFCRYFNPDKDYVKCANCGRTYK